MRKALATAVAVGILAGAGMAYAGLPAATGVNGSLHDMTRVVPGTADAMGRVCVYCHTPHHADSNDMQAYTAPLWNRLATNLDAYTPYQWITPANNMDENTGESFEILDPLKGPSRLCMSCHDGVIAVDEHGPAMAQDGGTTIQQINGGRSNLGYDLTKTHPIGFDYKKIRTWRNSVADVKDTLTGDSEIVDPEAGFATAITIRPDLATNQGKYNVVTRSATGKRIKDVLFGGSTMTCASCHEVHNKENATQDAYNGNNGSNTSLAPNYFLYAKQTESLICLSCHVK